MKSLLPLTLLTLALMLPVRADIKKFKNLPYAERQDYINARAFLTLPEGKRYDELITSKDPLTPEQEAELLALRRTGLTVAAQHKYFKEHQKENKTKQEQYNILEKWRVKNVDAVVNLIQLLMLNPDSPEATAGLKRVTEANDRAARQIRQYLAETRDFDALSARLTTLATRYPDDTPEAAERLRSENTLDALLFQAAQTGLVIAQNERLIEQNNQIVALLKQLVAKNSQP